ncbi:hypothetical protein [Roseovarius gaetbuli]|uniref:hypothetical protein n=1 Tax=Roseovarius gaetbuli TaxID=1356575 RepID=UPI00111C6A4E|nr:hypothetical protein [Roseovarius gaetbuli]
MTSEISRVRLITQLIGAVPRADGEWSPHPEIKFSTCAQAARYSFEKSNKNEELFTTVARQQKRPALAKSYSIHALRIHHMVAFCQDPSF